MSTPEQKEEKSIISGSTEQVSAFVTALAKTQSQLKDIKKTGQVTKHFKNKRTGQYDPVTYNYATIDDICKEIREKATANDLAVSQISSKAGVVKTYIMHSDGAIMEVETVIEVGDHMSFEDFGTSITYLRRYSLVSLFCMSAEDDDDTGNITENQEEERKAVEKQRDMEQGKGEYNEYYEQMKKRIAETDTSPEKIIEGIDNDKILSASDKETLKNLVYE